MQGCPGDKRILRALVSVSKTHGENLEGRNHYCLLLFFTRLINLYFEPIMCQALGPTTTLGSEPCAVSNRQRWRPEAIQRQKQDLAPCL